MLSPKRAKRAPCASCQAQAARAQTPKLAWTSSSSQYPTTTLRSSRMRLPMKPNSRSPCADWFRFMKSMSMSAHGISRLNCVWRCRNGFCRARRPRIHILAGEKVCIQVMRPTQSAGGVGLQAQLVNGVGGGQHRLEDNVHRDRGRVLQRLGNRPRVVGDLRQRLRAIQVLAAGDKPDLKLLQVDHWVSSFRALSFRPGLPVHRAR